MLFMSVFILMLWKCSSSVCDVLGVVLLMYGCFVSVMMFVGMSVWIVFVWLLF